MEKAVAGAEAQELDGILCTVEERQLLEIYLGIFMLTKYIYF